MGNRIVLMLVGLAGSATLTQVAVAQLTVLSQEVRLIDGPFSSQNELVYTGSSPLDVSREIGPIYSSVSRTATGPFDPPEIIPMEQRRSQLARTSWSNDAIITQSRVKMESRPLSQVVGNYWDGDLGPNMTWGQRVTVRINANVTQLSQVRVIWAVRQSMRRSYLGSFISANSMTLFPIASITNVGTNQGVWGSSGNGGAFNTVVTLQPGGYQFYWSISGILPSQMYLPEGEIVYDVNAVVTTNLDLRLCDTIDFNNDLITPDSADLDDFLAVLAGGPSVCSSPPNCSDLDFNNDGLVPSSDDLDAFLSRLAGGPCF